MDTFLTLLFFAAAAVVSAWLKRKQGQGDETWRHEQAPRTPGSGPASPAGAPPAPRPPRPVSWQEELRRLLEEGQPATPPVLEPQPPPVQPRAPIPGPPRLPPAPPVLAPAELSEEDVGLPVHLPSLQEAAQSFLQASHLDQTVQDRMERVDKQVSQHRLLSSVRAMPLEMVQARALLRDPVSLRAALIASIILGPPKAFER